MNVVYLRLEREHRGLTQEDVAVRTRIPIRYIQALETGDEEILPPGPFRKGYQRQYLDFLGLDPESEVAPYPEEPVPDDETRTMTASMKELPLHRLVIAGFLLTMAIVLMLRVAGTLLVSEDTPPPVEAEPLAVVSEEALPTARLRIRAIESTRLSTRVDGIESFSGTLDARNVIDLEGREEIEVWVENLTNIRLTYNGERIEPLGNLSQSRRLVFIQD